jgi:hypothetical protein
LRRTRLIRKLYVQDKIENFIKVVDEWGYSEVLVNQQLGMAINIGQEATLDLEGGKVYAFAGRCDSDCYHLRLELTDASGRVVKIGDDNDDEPQFIFQPPETARYVFKVYLEDASAGRSQVGVVILEGGMVS